MLYLRGYPGSPFTDEARALLTQLLEGELSAPNADDDAAPQVSSVEEAMIARAQASGEIGDYAAYLDRFPEGVFAELARSEIATKSASDPDADDGADVAVAAPNTQPTEETATLPDTNFGYETPLISALPEVRGLSLADLIEGSPLHAPIEGLPDELWKGQSCSNCHAWTREALCDQANVYRGDTDGTFLEKLHPYGGGFKAAMRTWATNDCQ